MDLELRSARFANVQSVAGSPLCHTSVSRWCEKAGKKFYTPEREERCGVLTASVARKAAELLNLQSAGKPIPMLPIAGTAAGPCVRCHELGGAIENTRAKVQCNGCHFHLGDEHPSI